MCVGGANTHCNFTSKPTTAWNTSTPGNHTVTTVCRGSLRRLLMMGTMVPETCWAVSTVCVGGATSKPTTAWNTSTPGNHRVTTVCRGRLRRLLMIVTMVPETCWAVSIRHYKYKIDCASGFMFYLNIWRRTEPQTINSSFFYSHKLHSAISVISFRISSLYLSCHIQ
jgi:hypothetical protein